MALRLKTTYAEERIRSKELELKPDDISDAGAKSTGAKLAGRAFLRLTDRPVGLAGWARAAPIRCKDRHFHVRMCESSNLDYAAWENEGSFEVHTALNTHQPTCLYAMRQVDRWRAGHNVDSVRFAAVRSERQPRQKADASTDSGRETDW